jgi:hypothetical protein
MVAIAMYLTQLFLTLLVCLLLMAYLRPALKRLLLDLCKTDARAHFWMVFSNILLIVLPVIFGMGYQPARDLGGNAFFSIAGQLRWNLLGFVISLISTGVVVSFFTLLAPRPQKNNERMQS